MGLNNLLGSSGGGGVSASVKTIPTATGSGKILYDSATSTYSQTAEITTDGKALTWAPTSTTQTVLSGTMPASFQGDFFKFSDSSGNDNVRAFQASGGASGLRIFGRPSQTGASGVNVGYTSFPASGNNVASYGVNALVSGTLYTGALVLFQAAETWSSSALGSDISLGTCNTGTASATTKLKITANGNIVLGTAARAVSATDGFLYLGNCAGKPTGTPTSYTGATPLVYDTTNKVFWAWDGSNWYNVAMRVYQTTQSADYTALVGDDSIVVTPGSGATTKTVTLPLAATVGAGKRFTITCPGDAGSGTTGVRVTGSGSDTAQGVAFPYSVGSSTVFGTITLESDGVSKYRVVSKV